jgi:hypothetical protein
MQSHAALKTRDDPFSQLLDVIPDSRRLIRDDDTG